MSTKDLVIAKVQSALNLSTKKAAENVLNKVVKAVEDTLVENLANNQFSLKLNSFGKFTVRHKKGILRKIPFTGETKLTSAKRKIKFVSLGPLRDQEVIR